jgi:hypothetical protein
VSNRDSESIRSAIEAAADDIGDQYATAIRTHSAETAGYILGDGASDADYDEITDAIERRAVVRLTALLLDAVWTD